MLNGTVKNATVIIRAKIKQKQGGRNKKHKTNEKEHININPAS